MEACHSQEQFNVTSYTATTVAIVTLEVFAGMWINAFIVSVICVTWIKKKTLNSNEKILLVVGCSRFWFLCTSWVYYFLSLIYPNYLYVYPIFQLVESAQSFLNCFNLWVLSCLCVFYCIKLASFRNSFFISLKVKIDRMVPWLLLGSVLFSLVIGIIAYDVTDKALCKNLNFTSQGRIWKTEVHGLPNYFTFGFGYATAFMAVIFSALLLLFSLWRHKRNTQANSMKNLSMDAHIKAMKFILSFLVMYSMNFVFFILTLIYAMKSQNHMVFLLYLFQYAFPGFHSLIVIFSNPKLEKTLLKVLSCMKCKFCMK